MIKDVELTALDGRRIRIFSFNITCVQEFDGEMCEVVFNNGWKVTVRGKYDDVICAIDRASGFGIPGAATLSKP